MTEEKEKILFEKYPNLFPNGKNVNPNSSLMCFGFPGDGWFDLIDDLCQKLTDLNIPIQVMQVKEKFGTLRFYVSLPENNTEDKSVLNDKYKKMDQLITEAEIKSEITCESCGKPGTIRGNGWVYVSCDECEKIREEKRLNQKW